MSRCVDGRVNMAIKPNTHIAIHIYTYIHTGGVGGIGGMANVVYHSIRSESDRIGKVHDNSKDAIADARGSIGSNVRPPRVRGQGATAVDGRPLPEEAPTEPTRQPASQPARWGF